MITHICLFILYLVITIAVLKATEIDKYINPYMQENEIIEVTKVITYDFELKFWHVLLMILVYGIPILGSIAFIVAIITYGAYTATEPEYSTGTLYVIRLKDTNTIARIINRICKRVK